MELTRVVKFAEKKKVPWLERMYQRRINQARNYIVFEGDTLLKIAKKMYVKVDDLAKAYQIIHRSSLIPGYELADQAELMKQNSQKNMNERQEG